MESDWLHQFSSSWKENTIFVSGSNFFFYLNRLSYYYSHQPQEMLILPNRVCSAFAASNLNKSHLLQLPVDHDTSWTALYFDLIIKVLFHHNNIDKLGCFGLVRIVVWWVRKEGWFESDEVRLGRYM